MSQRTFAKRLGWGVTTAAFGVATLTAYVKPAHADEIQGTPKAIIGGAFLGAEVVAIPMGIAGVRAGWAYAVFPGLGAIGGGIGGYFMDKAYDDAKTNAYGSAFMLVGGMALIIPTIVLILNATRYHPSAEATEDKAPTGPPADVGKPGGSVVAPSGATSGGGGTSAPSSGGGAPAGGGAETKAPYVPLSLVDVHEGEFRMGVPVPEVRYSYSLREVKEFGVPRTPELRLPVFRVAF